MPQREHDLSDVCPTTDVALSSPTCTSPMYAQQWNTQAPSGMVPIVTKMRYNSRESKLQSLAECCMPMGHSEKTTSWRTQLDFSSMASRNSQPLPPPSIAARTTGTLSATHFHSTHQLATPAHQENQKNWFSPKHAPHDTANHSSSDIRSMEHSSRTPSATHQPTPIYASNQGPLLCT